MQQELTFGFNIWKDEYKNMPKIVPAVTKVLWDCEGASFQSRTGMTFH